MLHCPRAIMRTVTYSGIFFATGFAPALAVDPTGDWKVADGVANIRVAECNGSIWGAVAWEKTPGGRDKNTPDVSKKQPAITKNKKAHPGRALPLQKKKKGAV